MKQLTDPSRKWFSDTERLIAIYFRKKERIKSLFSLEKTLKANLYEINLSLENYRRIPKLTARYSLSPGGGSGFSNGFENLMIEYDQEIERLMKEYFYASRRLVSIQCRIRSINAECALFDTEIEMLVAKDKCYRTIMEQRYIYRRSNPVIGEMTNRSASNIRYKIDQIVDHMAQVLNKRGKS